MISMSESLALEESSLKEPGMGLEDEGSALKTEGLLFCIEAYALKPCGELEGSSCLKPEFMDLGSDLIEVWANGFEEGFQGRVLPEEDPACVVEDEAEYELVGCGRTPDIRSKADGPGFAAEAVLENPFLWLCMLRAKSASSFSRWSLASSTICCCKNSFSNMSNSSSLRRSQLVLQRSFQSFLAKKETKTPVRGE
jgi:hypothetical protein